MKRLLSMILILVVVVGLVGCSKEPVGDSPTVNGQDYFNAELARRFDHLMYSIQLGLIQSKNINKPIKIVTDTAEKLSNKYTIP